ncbi:hypothetical protein HDU78_007117 [Chytriomyces hyalinus]|nr:hypothetical protein HDU78_007117 [Chytriomyces hyalinus]
MDTFDRFDAVVATIISAISAEAEIAGAVQKIWVTNSRLSVIYIFSKCYYTLQFQKMSDSTSGQNKPPKRFTGSTTFEFNIHIRLVHRYAQSKGVAYTLMPGWQIEAPAQITLPQVVNHPEPGDYPVGDPAAIAIWDVALNRHKLEAARNKDALLRHERSLARIREQTKDNERAVHILTTCFSESAMNRTDGQTLASEKAA